LAHITTLRYQNYVVNLSLYNNIFKEAYPYYSLPFCKPEHGIQTLKRPSGFGEILEGNELRNSGFKMHFGSNVYKIYH